MVFKETYNYTLSPTSVAWVYTDLNISVDSKVHHLPTEVTFDNNTASNVYVKLMDINEGNATSRTGFFLGVNQSKTVEIEADKDELPFYRAGARLVTGSGTPTIRVSGMKYKTVRV